MSSPMITLVTGANQGIGFYISQILASQYKYHVFMGCRSVNKCEASKKKLLEEDPSIDPSLLEPILIDLTSDKSIEAAAARVESQFGKLDILVNNAAIAKPDEGLSLRRQLDQIFMSNVSGTAAVTEAFIPLLRKSTASAPGKRIVFVSSGMGSMALALQLPLVEWTIPYNASKGALNRLALDYHKQLKDEGFVVTITTPGYCATNLNAYSGPETPINGAKSVVRSTVEGGSEVSGTFMKDGQAMPW